MNRPSPPQVTAKKIHMTNTLRQVLCVGAGGLGCEILKNLALSGFKDIHVIDMDTIDVTNLNRQFLFREKHLRNPKSQTAAAAAIYMNPDLKGNVIARLDKVHEGTSHIFTNKFFEDLTIVMNALDNV